MNDERLADAPGELYRLWEVLGRGARAMV